MLKKLLLKKLFIWCARKLYNQAPTDYFNRKKVLLFVRAKDVEKVMYITEADYKSNMCLGLEYAVKRIDAINEVTNVVNKIPKYVKSYTPSKVFK